MTQMRNSQAVWRPGGREAGPGDGVYCGGFPVSGEVKAGVTWGAVLVRVFAASAVETTEMVTIVVGVGVARRWRPTLVGAASGFVVLAALVVGLRQALSLIPIDVARIAIGALLLIFGLQWLRKGIFQVAAGGFWGGGGEE
jgi:uncharacterized membrane protein